MRNIYPNCGPKSSNLEPKPKSVDALQRFRAIGPDIISTPHVGKALMKQSAKSRMNDARYEVREGEALLNRTEPGNDSAWRIQP